MGNQVPGTGGQQIPSGTTPHALPFELEEPGANIIGGFRLDKFLYSEVLDKKGLKKLKKMNIDPDTETDILTLEAQGFDPKHFKTPFNRSLREADLLAGKQLASRSFLETVVAPSVTRAHGVHTAAIEGTEPPPEAAPGPPTPHDTLRQLSQGAMDLVNQGGALLGGDFSSPFAQDFLTQFNEQLTGEFAGRGLARAGPVAMEATLGGQTALRGIGGQMVQQGLGFLSTTDPTAFPADMLQRLDIMNQQNVFNFLANKELQAGRRAARFAGQALDMARTNQYVQPVTNLGGAALGGWLASL